MGEAWSGTEGSWETIGDRDLVENINEQKTESFWGNLGNLQNLYQQQTGGFFQPGGGFGDIWNAIAGATSPLQQNLSQYYQTHLPQMVEQGVAGVQQLGGANAGIAAQIAGQTGAQAASQMQNQMMQAQLGLLNPMAQQQLGQQYGMLGQVLGQTGQMAAPTYWEPSYVYQEGEEGWLKGLLGGALQGGLAGLMTGNPALALAGAGAGGLGSLLGMGGESAGLGALAAGGLYNTGQNYGWWPQQQQQPVYDIQQPSANWWEQYSPR
jgi:hypothetical protein